ncbi:MAG TPA: hypothetical protein VK464_13655 [Symbiobacteriaceae bacterium]|nr:hypothetical protein [Symbiobacteriaceae bacterium]
MVRRLSAGWLLLPAVLLVACSRPTALPSPNQGAGRTATPPAADPATPDPKPRPATKTTGARFFLYEGPPGFRLPENRRELAPGEPAVVGTGPVALDVALPVVTAVAALQAVKVEGAPQLEEPRWDPARGLTLSLGAGESGQQVTITVQLPGARPTVLTLKRVAPATASLAYSFGTEWHAAGDLRWHLPPGPGEVRLTFSKPVRRQEVEKALTEAQAQPVRGLMQWADDQTLIWQIAALPPRLDFLPGTARDQDGLPIPGGIPSLRVGEPPTLVELNLAGPTEQVKNGVPADILSATLVRGGQYLNLTAWVPGTNRWDWQATDLYLDLASGEQKPGRVEGFQPRLTGELENWVLNPGATLVAGTRTSRPGVKDLVIRDLRGGREQVIREFVRQVGSQQEPVYLAWAPDGLRVAALTAPPDPAGGLQVVALDLPALQQVVLARDLPLKSTGARLSLSAGSRYLLAGNVLVDTAAGTQRPLPGDPAKVRGAWEPDGTRLLYATADWGDVLAVDAAGTELLPLGSGLLVDWSGPGTAYLIRWPAAATRYLPPGQ